MTRAAAAQAHCVAIAPGRFDLHFELQVEATLGVAAGRHHRRKLHRRAGCDLDRERKTMMRLWAKREEQLRGVLNSTAGLYGDLQGIAGRAMQEIESLDVLMIEVKGEAAE